MNQFMQDIRETLLRLPMGFVLALAIVSSLGAAAVGVVDAVLIVPVPSVDQHNLVLAVLVSRTEREDAVRPSFHHLRLRAKLRSLDEPAEFSILGELKIEGPHGLIALGGVLPARNSAGAQREERGTA
jgi:hypothetical protein